MTRTTKARASAYSEARKAIGTQHAVAKLLGVARSTVARREAGTMPVTREATMAMTFLLECQEAAKGGTP